MPISVLIYKLWIQIYRMKFNVFWASAKKLILFRKIVDGLKQWDRERGEGSRYEMFRG